MDTPEYGTLALVLVGIGTVLPFVLLGPFFRTFKLRYLLAPIPFIVVGLGLIAWQVVALMAAFVAAFILWIYLFHRREEAYKRNYPVFETKPVRSIVSKDGFSHHLHIARLRSGFIIGIVYDTEVDLTPMTMQTRWKEVFPDYGSAERELLRRLADFIPADRMPDPS